MDARCRRISCARPVSTGQEASSLATSRILVTLFTAARAIAEERAQAMHAFLSRLEREIA